MLDADPENTMVMFGLAKEYEKLGQHSNVIELLETYLTKADDEGNAYGVLANSYLLSGNREKAAETYQKGIDVAIAHGHPSKLMSIGLRSIWILPNKSAFGVPPLAGPAAALGLLKEVLRTAGSSISVLRYTRQYLLFLFARAFRAFLR